MTPEKQKALEAIMGSLNRMAMKVIEAPETEREAIYEALRQSWIETQRQAGLHDKEVAELAQQYMIWLSELVSLIERSGGTQGGTA